jgi:phage tail sheath protein FI
MAVNPLAPGVYIDEISVFPPSVAPVATAIPAFIGYTEKGPLNAPTRITSLLEYEQVFGGPFKEQFDITLTGPSTAPDDTTIAISNSPALTKYSIHYQLQMFYANGGGPCYIVAVGLYNLITPAITATDFTNSGVGIDVAEKVDEVTLLVVPEAIYMSHADRKTVYDKMLLQCANLKDRFAILDAEVHAPHVSVFDDANGPSGFRSADVSSNNLKYGAAYYPSLDTVIGRLYLDSQVDITDSRTGGPFTGKKLTAISGGTAATATYQIISFSGNVGDTLAIGSTVFTAIASGIPGPTDYLSVSTDQVAAQNLASTVNAHPVASQYVTATVVNDTVTFTAKNPATLGTAIAFIYTDAGSGGAIPVPNTGTMAGGGVSPDVALYNRIKALLAEYRLTLYPCGAMAGIYANVDRDRGVWKAPANVSVLNIIKPSLFVTSDEQEVLNVDATSGKSINAIRTFAGKGDLVWGARTLAGNDNEWRYVPVRRLFIFAEESIGKASEFVVFEPNDRNTWTRVKTLIANFLTNLWRDGALAGATPDDAFFIKVGLGETMTPQDILEGKMIIQVGMAAVRPAEFIILEFMHKLQES